jgi:hypothetical protein
MRFTLVVILCALSFVACDDDEPDPVVTIEPVTSVVPATPLVIHPLPPDANDCPTRLALTATAAARTTATPTPATPIATSTWDGMLRSRLAC